MAGYTASNWWDGPLTAAQVPQLAVPDVARLTAPPDVSQLIGGMSSISGLPQAASGGGSWFDGFLGKTLANGDRTQGWGGAALGVAQGLGNAYLGFKQLGVARDTLEANKRQFQLNYDAQKKTTNARLEDQQRARVASNPGAYQSVGDYMGKYGI